MKRRGWSDTTKANNYLHYLIDKINQQDNFIKACKEAMANYITLEQVVEDQRHKISELTKKAENLEKADYKVMLEETTSREADLVDKIDKMEQTIKHLEELHVTKENQLLDTVNQLNNEIKAKEDLLKYLIEKEDTNKSKDSLKLILEKIHRLEYNMRNIRQEDSTQGDTQTTSQRCPTIYSQPQQSIKTAAGHEEISSYSSIMKKSPYPKLQQKNPTQMSRSALLIKRLPNTNISVNEIRNIITRETKEKLQPTEIFCEISRNKNTLIVKSSTDKKNQYTNESNRRNYIIKKYNRAYLQIH